MRAYTLFLSLAVVILAIADPVLAQGDDRLIKRGDKFYENRGKGRKWCERSIECYEKALAVNPESVAASWRLAKACYWLGMHTDGEEPKLRIYKKGIDVAKRAITIDEKSVECRYWLGVSYGKYGETKGVTSSLGLVEPIKKEMNRIIELDETYEDGGAHRVLGRLLFKLPGVMGGDTKMAIEHLEKAIEIGGSHLLNHLFLAQVLVGEDMNDRARKTLQFIIDAPYQEHRRPENEEEKAEAKKMLAELDE